MDLPDDEEEDENALDFTVDGQFENSPIDQNQSLSGTSKCVFISLILFVFCIIESASCSQKWYNK